MNAPNAVWRADHITLTDSAESSGAAESEEVAALRRTTQIQAEAGAYTRSHVSST